MGKEIDPNNPWNMTGKEFDPTKSGVSVGKSTWLRMRPDWQKKIMGSKYLGNGSWDIGLCMTECKSFQIRSIMNLISIVEYEQ